MNNKKILIVLTFLITVASSAVFFLQKPIFEERRLLKAENCRGFFDEQEKISSEHFASNRDPLINDLMDQGLQKQAWTIALKPLKAQMAIGNRVKECGPHDKRFYKAENNLCQSKLVSAELESILTLLEEDEDFNTRQTEYCDEAFKRGDRDFLFNLFYFHAVGISSEKNLKTALHYLNKVIEKHPNYKAMLSVAAKIYEAGGYGLQKDETKALKIMLEASESDTNGQIYCELEHYYKNGIGTDVDLKEAKYWANKYNNKKPDEECVLGDYSFLFQPSRFSRENLSVREKCIHDHYAPETQKCKNTLKNKQKRVECYHSAADRSKACREEKPVDEWPKLLLD